MPIGHALPFGTEIGMQRFVADPREDARGVAVDRRFRDVLIPGAVIGKKADAVKVRVRAEFNFRRLGGG